MRLPGQLMIQDNTQVGMMVNYIISAAVTLPDLEVTPVLYYLLLYKGYTL